ncbi:MAG: tetratricopeptide repeat protein [Bacteroidetes bacterium]|nr:tetratricopeptide repeat protein [Bacteroidota bacterium]MDA0938581.1 tetratricopeptide repeat protein [Bacteroidota bacterium]MDA1344972.1 tetratricopeptide repeat protein [Bacteroidota bacterium]
MFNGSSDHTETSIHKFEQMLETNRVLFFDAQEFEEIAHYYIDYGQLKKAKRALKLGLEQHPDNVELLLIKSEMMIYDDELEAAEVLLDYIAKMAPNHEEIFLQKANLYSRSKRHDEAIALLNEILDFTDDPIEIWSMLGMEYLVLEDYQKATQYFSKCLEDNPEDYQALYNMLYCLEQLEDLDGAVAVLNNVLNSNPYSEIAWHQLGKIYTQQNKIKEALSAYDFAIISDDTFSGAYIEKAKLLEANGRLNEAISLYELTLQLSEASGFSYYKIGSCHLRLGNHRLAVQFFKKAVSIEPGYEKGWMALVDYYAGKKDFEKAKYFVKQGIHSNEDSINLWKRCAHINVALELYEDADYAYEIAVNLGNYEWKVWIGWIDALLRLNDWNKALTVCYQAKEYYPDKIALDLRMTGCYLKLGKTTESEFFIKSCRGIKLPKALHEFFPELGQQLSS